MTARRGGSQLGDLAAARQIARSIVLYERRGVQIAAKWPRKRGRAATPAQADARAHFAAMVRAIKDLDQDYLIWAQSIEQPGQYTWRDYLSRFLTGPGIVEVDGLLTITTQAALDTISQVPGAILYRDGDAWVALLPGDPADILTIDAGKPKWLPPNTSGGGALIGAQFAACTVTHNFAATPAVWTAVPELSVVVGPFTKITRVAVAIAMTTNPTHCIAGALVDGTQSGPTTTGANPTGTGANQMLLPTQIIQIPGDGASHTIAAGIIVNTPGQTLVGVRSYITAFW